MLFRLFELFVYTLLAEEVNLHSEIVSNILKILLVFKLNFIKIEFHISDPQESIEITYSVAQL